MKKIYSIMMIAATLTLWCGCSSSDDDDNNKNSCNNNGSQSGEQVANAPGWTFNPSPPAGDIEGLPDWKKVNFYDYDNNMTAIVFVSTDFGTKVTESDRMAAVINGEVRDVCTPVYYNLPDEKPLLFFMLYIPFNTGEDGVDLQYYNAQRNQTYIQKNQFSVNDDTVGDDDLFLFSLRPMLIQVFTLPKNVPFTPTENDEMAAFIGDECCGVAELSDTVNSERYWAVVAYDMNQRHEKAYIRYYSADTKTIYETEPFLDFTQPLIVNEPYTLQFK